jgi:hypothetical protein
MTPATTYEPVSLDEVRRYAREHQATPEEAAELFRETLKWLYLCGRAATDGPEGLVLVVHPEIEKIDEMWHTFLLFTRDYAEFCDRYFGLFLHHVPGEDGDEAPPEEGPVRAALEAQYAFVYEVLGPQTLTAWYDDCRYATTRDGARK